MNKTTMDAVIEFKGETPKWSYFVASKLILLCIKDTIDDTNAYTKRMYAGGAGFNNEYFVSVCTELEFNTLVDWLSTNKGRCAANIANEYALSDKKPALKVSESMEIDWSKAPEGATHAWESKGCFYNFSEKGGYCYGLC